MRQILVSAVCLVFVAGCAGMSPSVALPTSGTPASPSAPSANPTSAAAVAESPTLIAVLPGEPWIVYEWVAGDNGVGTYLVRPDGRDQHQILTDLGPHTYHADWSPDGQLIAFELGQDAGDIWTSNADGTDSKKLVGCDGTTCQWVALPAWSPDGKKLAYNRFDPAGVNGSERDEVSIEVLDLATGTRSVVAKAPPMGTDHVEAVGPRWSPDGSEIAFNLTNQAWPPSGPLLGGSVAIVKADGSEVDTPRVLTDPALLAAGADWSPDGERIVFNNMDLAQFQDTTDAVNLYTVRPDGTGLTQVTHFGDHDTRATQASWTPDGKQVIFTWIGCEPDCQDAQWGNRYIGIVDADGSNLKVLDGQFATHPRMRPTP